MPISIKDPETDRLARELAQATGETITEAIAKAVKERLRAVKSGRQTEALVEELDEIAQRCAALPTVDHRTDDEILGYDEIGLPR